MGRYIGIVLMIIGAIAFIGSVFFLFLLSVMSAALTQLPADLTETGMDMQVQEFGVMLGVLWVFSICWLVSSVASFWFGWTKFKVKKK
ncbi:MAG: hypothetical protein V1802_02595 [Candidatus Aenigmatarchaeota archaeon]